MLTRWKILACSLTVGVGGLAVFATPPTEDKKEPPPLLKLTVKPDSPPNGTDTPAPPAGAKPGPGLEFDLDVPPVPVLPAKAPDKPPTPPVIELDVPTPPTVVIPVKGEDKKPAVKDEPKPAADPLITPPIPELKPAPLPAPENKPAVALPPPPAPKVETPIAPLPPTVKPEESKPAPLPEVTKALPVTPEPPRATATVGAGGKGEPAKLKMLLRMGDGNPRFEIRNATTTELLLKVYGEKIDLQTPAAASKTSVAGVSATGKVRFTAPGVEGYCDSLKIISATGEVLMEGEVRLTSKRGKYTHKLTADRVVFTIGNAGLTAPKATVKPVGHTELK
jgi:hypothetical protein